MKVERIVLRNSKGNERRGSRDGKHVNSGVNVI
jgi:hypothetical protein